MGKLESVQYSPALAITGTWREISRDKLYLPLGWESLNFRRCSRRLTLLYKVLNNLSPLYTKELFPSPHQQIYFIRDRNAIKQIGARTETSQSSFYLHCFSE